MKKPVTLLKEPMTAKLEETKQRYAALANNATDPEMLHQRLFVQFIKLRADFGIAPAVAYLRDQGLKWPDICAMLIQQYDVVQHENQWRKTALEQVTIIRCKDCGFESAGWTYNPCPECHGVVENAHR